MANRLSSNTSMNIDCERQFVLSSSEIENYQDTAFASYPDDTVVNVYENVGSGAQARIQPITHQDVGERRRCWEHGCGGRHFASISNLRRHQREKSAARPGCCCPECGAIFSRTTARNQHIANASCNRIRRYSNGRDRPSLCRSNGERQHVPLPFAMLE